jgi:hypothetical protein
MKNEEFCNRREQSHARMSFAEPSSKMGESQFATARIMFNV